MFLYIFKLFYSNGTDSFFPKETNNPNSEGPSLILFLGFVALFYLDILIFPYPCSMLAFFSLHSI